MGQIGACSLVLLLLAPTEWLEVHLCGPFHHWRTTWRESCSTAEEECWGVCQQSNVLVTDICEEWSREGDWPPHGLSEDIPLCRFCVIFLAYLWILSAHVLLEAGWTFRFQNFEPNVLYQCHCETLITEALIQQSILSQSWHSPYVFVRSLAFWWSTEQSKFPWRFHEFQSKFSGLVTYFARNVYNVKLRWTCTNAFHDKCYPIYHGHHCLCSGDRNDFIFAWFNEGCVGPTCPSMHPYGM